MKRFGNTNFDLDYCKQFSTNQLRSIYKGDLSDDVELLISELYPSEVDEEKHPEIPEKPKKDDAIDESLKTEEKEVKMEENPEVKEEDVKEEIDSKKKKEEVK